MEDTYAVFVCSKNICLEIQAERLFTEEKLLGIIDEKYSD